MLYKRQLMILQFVTRITRNGHKLTFSTYYVLLDSPILQIRKIALVKLKQLLIRKEITKLYSICNRQRFQIAVTT